MLTLLSGGVRSGKSTLAEKLAEESGAKDLYYIATMLVSDDETKLRVEKHVASRGGKGYVTLECPLELEKIFVPNGSAVLLDCLTNLVANECFTGAGFEGVSDRVMSGIVRLNERASRLVIVTNELFSDGIEYGELTEDYLRVMAEINMRTAMLADSVIEAVCSIPVILKGEI